MAIEIINGSIANSIFRNTPPQDVTREKIQSLSGHIPGRRELRISITDQCNLKCGFCHNEGQGIPSDRSLSISQIDTLLKVASAFQPKSIRFTGGEPTIHSEVKALIKKIDEWQKYLPNVSDWGINTNGVALAEQPDLLAVLALSSLTKVVIGIDSIEPSEKSKPASKNGISGEKIINEVVEPLCHCNLAVQINTVYTGNNDRVRKIIHAGISLGVPVSVIEVNGITGPIQHMRQNFLDFANEITTQQKLQAGYDNMLNQVYLFQPGTTETPKVKFYQDHCADVDCGHCRKLHIRVVPAQDVPTLVPCFLKNPGKSIPLSKPSNPKIVDRKTFAYALVFSGRGPNWQTRYLENPDNY